MPAGVAVCPEDFSLLLQRRFAGYGRGQRARIETDQVEVLSGLIGGVTTGSPISLLIRNADYATHTAYMHPFNPPAAAGHIAVPLPGHADFAGTRKYGLNDCRPVRERASARETAMRTALSVPARCLLKALGIRTTCLVERIGPLSANVDYTAAPELIATAVASSGNDFMTPDPEISKAWRRLVDESAAQKISLGGSGAVICWGLPVGLGSHVQFDRRLDNVLAGLIMSIPAVRGVEFGLAAVAAASCEPVADRIDYNPETGFSRGSNRAAGLEGGMTTGQPLIMRFHMKPPPGNARVPSVNLNTLSPEQPAVYRSDTQAVTAAAIVAESVVAIQLASEIIASTGGSSLKSILDRLGRP